MFPQRNRCARFYLHSRYLVLQSQVIFHISLLFKHIVSLGELPVAGWLALGYPQRSNEPISWVHKHTFQQQLRYHSQGTLINVEVSCMKQAR